MKRVSNIEELMILSPDLVEFCRSGIILPGEFRDYAPSSTSPFSIVSDIADATRYFGDQSAEIDEVYPGFEYFSGLQEQEFNRLDVETPHWFSGQVERLLVQRLNEQLIDSGLGNKIPFLFDSITTTIEFGLCNNFSEHPSRLFTLILDAFYRGRWPCGWKERYPDGKLLVYVPESK